MKKISFYLLSTICSIAVTLIVIIAGMASAASLEQETLAHLERIKAMRADADAKTMESYNKNMDATWQFFNTNKSSVLPILRQELKRELQSEKPNQMLLLDIGYFIRLQPDAADRELGKTALLRIDPGAPIVRWNQPQLFLFAHLVAADQDPQILPFLDKAFLYKGVTAYLPQHALKLDETLVCVFLYGIHSGTSEQHLRSLLGNRDIANKVVEILIWLGTPASVPAVKEAMMGSRDYETFTRGTAFMMRTGGPQGRSFMLSVNPKDFDIKSQQYYAKVRKDIEAVSYQTLSAQFSGAGKSALTDKELKQRLAAMYENYGKDKDTEPSAILNSSLPKNFLISEIQRIRSRMFYRLSDEALDDVQMTNAILNALYFKQK